MDLICCVSQALPPLSPVFYRHFFPFVREAGSLSPQLLIQIQSQIVSVNYLSVSLLHSGFSCEKAQCAQSILVSPWHFFFTRI